MQKYSCDARTVLNTYCALPLRARSAITPQTCRRVCVSAQGQGDGDGRFRQAKEQASRTVEKHVHRARDLVGKSSKRAEQLADVLTDLLTPKERGGLHDWSLMILSTLLLVWLSAQAYRLTYYTYLQLHSNPW